MNLPSTVAQALAQAQAAGLARIDAQLLLLHALGRKPHDRAWLIAHDTDVLPPTSLLAWDAALARRCREAFVAWGTRPSSLEEEVAGCLRAMGAAFEREAVEPRTGYAIDFLVRTPAGPVALEVDGPSHFVHGSARPRPNGPTLLKQKLLESAGWRTVAVEYWVWDACAARGADAEREYLEALLQLAPAVGPEAAP